MGYYCTTQDLAVSIQKAGGTARTFGVDLEQLLGHVTAIGEVTRESGAIVGTGLKTIYSRITTINEAVELLNQVGVATHDMQGNIRPVGDILDELGGKWNGINTEMQQQIGLQVAGRYQLSRFLTLMQQYDQAIQATGTAMNSQGSATKENEKYLESYEARLNKLSNAWTNLSLAMGDALLGNGIIAFAESMTAVAKGAGVVVDKVGLLAPILSVVALGFIMLNKRILESLTLSGLMAGSTWSLSTALSTMGTVASVAGKKLAGGFMLAMRAIPAVGAIFAVSFAIEKLIGLFIKARNEAKKIEAELQKNTKAYSDNRSAILALQSEYETLSNNTNRNAEEQQRFLEVQNELAKVLPSVNIYTDENGQAHLKTADSIKREVEHLEELRTLEASKFIDGFTVSINKKYEALEKTNKEIQEMIELQAKQKAEENKKTPTDTTGRGSQYSGNPYGYAPVKPKVTDDDITAKNAKKKLETDELIASYKELANKIIQVRGYEQSLNDTDKVYINTLIEKNRAIAENVDKQEEFEAMISDTIDGLHRANETLGASFDMDIFEKSKNEIKDLTQEQLDALESVSDALNSGSMDFEPLTLELDKAGFNHADIVMGELIERKYEVDRAFESGIFLDVEGTQQIESYEEVNRLLAEGVPLYNALGNAIGDVTDAIVENTEATWEKVSATEVLLGVTSDTIDKQLQALMIVSTLGGAQNLSAQQSEYLAGATQYLAQQYPQFTGAIYENVDAMYANATMMSELNSASASNVYTMTANQNSITNATVSQINQRIMAYNQELQALSKMYQSAITLANAYETATGEPSPFRGYQRNIQNRISVAQAGLAKAQASKVKATHGAYVPKKSSGGRKGGGGGSKKDTEKDKYVTDKYAQAIDALDVKLSELEAKKEKYAENSSEYRKITNQEIGLHKQKLDLTNKEIARLEGLANAERKRNGSTNNEELDDIIDSLNGLKEERIDLQLTIDDLKRQVVESFYNEIVEKAEKDFDDFEKRIKAKNRQISMSDEEDANLQIKLNKEKLELLLKQRQEGEAIIKELEDASKELKGHPDLIAENNERIEEWKETLADLNVDIHEITEALIQQREDIAENLIDAMKEYYKAKQKIEQNALDKELKALEKAHEEKMKMYDDELEAYQKIVDEKLKEMDKQESEEDFNKDLTKKQAEQQKIISQINALALDDSLEAKSKRAELEKELAEITEEIEEMKLEREKELVKEGLEANLEAKEQEIEQAKENAEYEVEINGEKVKGTFEQLQERLEMEREELDKHYENILENERYWAQVRQDILDGNTKTYTDMLATFAEEIGNNYDVLGESIGQNLQDQLNEASKEIKGVTSDLEADIDRLLDKYEQAKKREEKKDTPSSGGGSSGGGLSGGGSSSGGGGSSGGTKASDLPLRKKSGGFAQPRGGWDKSSVVDYLKSKSYYAEYKDREALYKALKGSGTYGGSASQNTWLLKKLKSVTGLRSGGYTGDWVGNEGKLAFLHKKELVLKEKDTSRLLTGIKLLDKLSGRLNLDGIRMPNVPSVQQPSVINNYNLDLRIDNLTGDRKGGEEVFSTIVKGLKKLGKQ